ncbi:retinol dehydrogenase 12-like [Neocloeon triangulifer]|uniref:retinol dehydrogenase 12-like n=1 Tax=Neocloeon triangulifer TaxID=2078957 RepID=UPI00286F7D2D|nr:retinol dehydrogenase 12-like [Neocloeon triangulifer]XP_059483327.1 retinol dehydrogenase 12-like [Neocloeon triangulifer]XP_059483328.1 retinol dehydrogenase 12-like [Neocloeon triangulifer]XP_059483329.1 retinol dehydrogenase 12-like [Neocloeon triangulifer]XP_059483331.1 retinol dehydrogenase 12-like [Neocloeon triangulifer]
MWMYFVAAAPVVWLVVLLSSLYNCPQDKITMSNFFDRCRQQALYNAIGMKANLDDLFNKRKNRFALPSNLKGRVVVITGGTRGIGVEVIRQLLKCDMQVVIGCRKVSAGEKVVEEIRKSGVETGTTKVFECDTSTLDSTRNFAQKVLNSCPKVHILINNAGIMLVPYEETVDGHESQWQVNYLSHFLLTKLLLPRLEESASNGLNSRIVNLSSSAHLGGKIDFDNLEMKKNYVSSTAYGTSKLAQLMFTKSLQRSFDARGAPLQIHSVHPGVVNTDLFKGTYIDRMFPWMPRLLFKTPTEGATPVLYAALSPDIEGKACSYISNCSEYPVLDEANDVEKQDKLFEISCKDVGVEKFTP